MNKRNIIALAVLFAMVNAQSVFAESRFGGEDRIVNNDSEIANLVRHAKANNLSVSELKQGLTRAERKLVQERGLTPAGPIVQGESDALPPGDAPAARSANAGSNAHTFYCYRKSLAGIKMYQYNSRWSWSWGSAHNIRTASHTEWPSNTAPGWKYLSDKYLWLSGGWFTKMIGRATQARFSWQPLGYYLWDAYLINDVRVWAHGGVNYCS